MLTLRSSSIDSRWCHYPGVLCVAPYKHQSDPTLSVLITAGSKGLLCVLRPETVSTSLSIVVIVLPWKSVKKSVGIFPIFSRLCPHGNPRVRSQVLCRGWCAVLQHGRLLLARAPPSSIPNSTLGFGWAFALIQYHVIDSVQNITTSVQFKLYSIRSLLSFVQLPCLLRPGNKR